MRIGSPRVQLGFTYLLLLFAITLGGIGIAAIGEQARLRMQREREAELMFRGKELARAIASYLDAGPAGSRSAPQTVDDLLDDHRSGRSVHHLRKLYIDPLTGKADWTWLKLGEQGCGVPPDGRAPSPPGLAAVASSSTQPLLKRGGSERRLACELVFDPGAFLQPKPTATPDNH